MHRGTYTSHAKIKKGNRYSEILLREVEFWSALAIATQRMSHDEYDKSELDRLWKGVLL